MSSSYGENLHLTIFGQSHSPAIGMTLEGIPAGEHIDFQAVQSFMERRAPGRNAYSTARREADAPEFISGVRGEYTCGVPLTAIIHNGDQRSKDYAAMAAVPRPGHADYTANVKYFGYQDYAGGGHFSGRMTAPLCIAGAVCLQILQRQGIEIISRIKSIGQVEDGMPLVSSTADKTFPTVSDEAGEKMQTAIAEAKLKGDSLGGIIECMVLGLPAGVGDPMFGGMENRIASIVFGIPAVKGIEFGAGFEAAKMSGSQNNDVYTVRDGRVETKTNNCGGILGGITDGMPLVFRAALKPTPSISMEQDSINMNTLQEEKLVVGGRHDPCIVPRAVPVMEAAAAIAVYDALLGRRKELR